MTPELQWIAPSVNKNAVNRFFQKMKDVNYEVHTLQIYRHNQQILRIAQAPYSCTDAREVYSLSKTFTSSVIGIASDMGLLSVEDYVLDYFPEIKTDSEYFKKLKIKHVLSMNTGHSACVMSKMRLRDNAVEGFFSVEPEFEPGTHFAYNTGATCLLGYIIKKVTGKDFFDFACEKLFFPMEMYNIRWSLCHDGGAQCGTGLHICNDDIVKLGLLYLNKGVYKGKRILSEKWIEEATSAISDNSTNGEADWCNGYGYQIWINSRDGFRGDGAFGQLCMVFPKYDAVVAVQAIGPSMQDEINIIYDLMEHLDGEEGVAETFAFAPYETQENVTPFHKIYKLSENCAGFRTADLLVTEEMVQLSFSDGGSVQTIRAGNGEWLLSEFHAKHMIPLLNDLMTTEYVELIRTAACFQVKEGEIVLCVRYLTNPHTEYFTITTENQYLKIQIESACRAQHLKYIGGKEV